MSVAILNIYGVLSDYSSGDGHQNGCGSIHPITVIEPTA